MNGQAAKFNRREIRRSFTPDAVKALGEGSERIQHIDRGLAEMAKYLEFQRQELQRQANEARELRERSFLGRLRWLLTGR